MRLPFGDDNASFGDDGAGGSGADSSFPSGEPVATHRTSPRRRGLALLSAAGALLLAGLAAASDRPLFSWWTLLDLATTGSLTVAAAAYGLHARIEIFEDGLRRVRPLRRDEGLRFDDVERVLLPMTSAGLMLFTAAGSTPALAVDGSAFERFDRLALRVCRRLPDAAEVEDPVGRLDAYRGDDDRTSDDADAAD